MGARRARLGQSRADGRAHPHTLLVSYLLLQFAKFEGGVQRILAKVLLEETRSPPPHSWSASLTSLHGRLRSSLEGRALWQELSDFLAGLENVDQLVSVMAQLDQELRSADSALSSSGLLGPYARKAYLSFHAASFEALGEVFDCLVELASRLPSVANEGAPLAVEPEALANNAGQQPFGPTDRLLQQLHKTTRDHKVYFWRYVHGLQHRMLHDAMDCLRSFLEGYAPEQQEGQPDFAQYSILALAGAFTDLDHLGEALQSVRESVGGAQEATDSVVLAFCLHHLSQVLLRGGMHSSAFLMLHRCLVKAELLEQPALAALSALGLARLLAEHPELAQPKHLPAALRDASGGRAKASAGAALLAADAVVGEKMDPARLALSYVTLATQLAPDECTRATCLFCQAEVCRVLGLRALAPQPLELALQRGLLPAERAHGMAAAALHAAPADVPGLLRAAAQQVPHQRHVWVFAAAAEAAEERLRRQQDLGPVLFQLAGCLDAVPADQRRFALQRFQVLQAAERARCGRPPRAADPALDALAAADWSLTANRPVGALRSALRARKHGGTYAELAIPVEAALRIARVHIQLKDFRAALQVLAQCPSEPESALPTATSAPQFEAAYLTGTCLLGVASTHADPEIVALLLADARRALERAALGPGRQRDALYRLARIAHEQGDIPARDAFAERCLAQYERPEPVPYPLGVTVLETVTAAA